MTAENTVLVLGGTGRQGGAVARALLGRGWVVHALVRDPRTGPARALAGAGAVLIGGDLNDEESLRTAMKGIHGVFSVQPFRTPGGVAAEERQGKAVGDAAAKAGVAHLVYSSVGGAERDSGVAHFDSKWHVEQHLSQLGVPTTVLRPTMFCEVFADVGPRFAHGQLVLGLWLRPEVPLQLIATSDIGAFAADAFDDPATWLGRQVEIAGDELTGPQMAAAFERVSGVPVGYRQQPIEQLRTARADLAAMFGWFDREGYRADLPALRRLRPDLVTLETWLRANWTAPVVPSPR